MRSPYISFLAALLVLAACSRAGQSGHKPEANFGAQIDPEQNLTFTFPADVVPDSVVGRWDTVQLVTLQPRVPGQVRWTSRRELTFSPRQPFAPATEYQIEVHGPKAGNASGFEGAYAVHTPALALTGARAWWAGAPGVAGAAEARLQLHFNYPVRPADVGQRLQVAVAGTKIEARTEGTNLTTDVTVVMPSVGMAGSEADPVPVVARLAAGMPTPGSTQKTAKPLEIGTEVPPRAELNITEMTGAFADGKGLLSVFTTQPVIIDDVPALVSVSPGVVFTVRALDNGFQLVGDFVAGKAYDVTISGQLRGAFGPTLKQDYRQGVSFGTEPPRVAFADAGRMYLGAAGARNLALTLAGVQRVQVTVAKVYETNLQNFFKAGQSYGWDNDSYQPGSDGEWEDHSYQYYDVESVGDVLLSRTVDVKSMPRDGRNRLLHLALNELEFDRALKGVYVIRVRDTERRWLQASQIVVVSDIGLIARQSRAGLVVFAASVKTAAPLPNVEITCFSTNNQPVAKATTGADGTVVIKAEQIGRGLGGFNRAQDFAASRSSDGGGEGEYYEGNRSDDAMPATNGRFEIGLLTARQGQDFSMLDLNRSRIDVARFDVGGLQSNTARYLAFCYGDRDLYRPGDTIRTNTLVREPDGWKPVVKVPIKVRLLLPSGREYQAQHLTLDDQGAAPATFIIPTTVMTGRWTLEVLTGNDVLLSSRKLSVEEFMPDRMRVKVDVSHPVVQAGQSQIVNVTANTLFGPPAANRRYEIEVSLKRAEFQPKGYDDYRFDLASHNGDALERLEHMTSSGELDAQGKVSQFIGLPALQDLGLLTGTAFVAVFDETGRPVNRLADFKMPTQTTMYGVGRFDSWLGTNRALAVPIVALTPDGKPRAGAPVQVEIIRRVWETVLESNYGRFSYNSQPREKSVFRQQLTTGPDGRVSLSYTAIASGDYEVRIGRPGSGTWVAAPFYAYGFGNTTSNAFAVNNEGRVDISPDKERYRVGETAKLLLKTPFKGRLLVTVERDKVIQHYQITTDARSASIDVPLTTDCLPNVFVTVTAIRPHGGGGDETPLTVARGYQPLIVEAPEAKLPVAITVAEKSRSRRALPISVKTAPNARVTLAIVDEGILQMKDFKTPDPYGFFYQRRALEVLGYDLYPLLFPERNVGSVGAAVGGDAFSLAKRVNPFKSKRVRLVSIWSGVLKADGSGVARFTAKVPQFSGALRVMAVAYKDNAFGSEEREVKVADPVVISAALPRFLSPRDTIAVPVTLTNTTNAAAPATASLTVSGPMRVVGAVTVTTSVPANAETQVRFRLVAPAGVGTGAVEVVVKTLGETFRDRTELAVRPAAALTSFAESGSITGGETRTLDFGATAYLPGTLTARLTVGRSPMARFSDDLRYLIQYPYGCLEQTVSAAFPQLYYPDLARALGQSPGQAGYQPTRYNPGWHVQEAIRKLESMQQPDGSLSYWPGGTETNWWASTYAAHFLTEAQRAGQPVNRGVLDRLLTYLSAQTRPRPTVSETLLDAQGKPTARIIAKREALYSLYVLALHQRADASTLNYYKANLPLLAAESRYLLAAALLVSGNVPAARGGVPASFNPAAEAAQRNLSGDFASPLRDEAIGLLALLDVSPDHPTVPLLARRLSQQLGSARWYSTQERSFALLALGKQARRDAASTVTATLAAGARQLARFDGPPLVVSDGLAGQAVRVQTAGKGPLYFTRELEGIPTDRRRVPLVDENLLVRREFLTRAGLGLPDEATFRQGDLVVVRLTLRSPATVAQVPNVAVADLLPAGLEIENPRLGPQREIEWAQNNFEPEYLDVRDDRLTLFTTATPEPKVFYYLARAVTAGTFEQAPITAAAMYDATYRSTSGGGVVRVTK